MNYYRCAGLWLQCATTDKKTSRLWVEVQSEAPISSFNKLGGWNPSPTRQRTFFMYKSQAWRTAWLQIIFTIAACQAAQKYNLSVRLELASGRGMLHPKWKSKFPELQRQVGGKVHKSANRKSHKSRKSAMRPLCFSINSNRSTDQRALQSKEITACSFQSETACCLAERRRDRGSKL